MSRVVGCKGHVDTACFLCGYPSNSGSVNYVLVEHPGETLDGFFRNYCFNCWDRNVKRNLFLWVKFPLMHVTLILYRKFFFSFKILYRKGLIKNTLVLDLNNWNRIRLVGARSHLRVESGIMQSILWRSQCGCSLRPPKIYARRLRYLRAPLDAR